jgi:hypothetical protein
MAKRKAGRRKVTGETREDASALREAPSNNVADSQ